jgi:hypothetical protein
MATTGWSQAAQISGGRLSMVLPVGRKVARIFGVFSR